MVAKIYVDGVLIEWGTRMFVGPVSAKAAAPLKFKPARGKQSGALRSLTAGQVRQRLNSLAKKAPEVMVKISGGGRSMKSIGAHMDYISRNGEVELEDDLGNIVKGRDEVLAVKNEWNISGYGIRDEDRYNQDGKPTGPREAVNIVLSMPPGTDREAVKRAAREFAQSEFGGRHHYVMAQHNDEEHPHVHICVRSRSYVDQKRLNPRKADLQQWRENFAEKLRDNGIEASATKRRVRGRTQSTERLSVLKMKERGVGPDKAAREPQKHTDLPEVVASYRHMAKALAESEDLADRKLAVDLLTQFVGNMEALKPLSSENAPKNQAIKYRKEIHNERPDYDKLRAGHVRGPDGFIPVSPNLHQSGRGQPRFEEQAITIARLRDVSGIAMVHDQRSVEMLLHANARHRMEQPGGQSPASTNHDVRRARVGDSGDARSPGVVTPDRAEIPSVPTQSRSAPVRSPDTDKGRDR